MKNQIFTVVLVFCFCVQMKAQDHFLGFWSNENKTQIIKIYKKDDLYYGDLMYKKEKPLKEIKEKVVLVQMKRRNKKVLHKGTYIDHDLNREYEIELILEDSRTIVINVVKNNLISKIWHRVP